MSPDEMDSVVVPNPAPATRSSAIAVAGPPARVLIPSIALDAPIQKVGVNAKGEVDVPDGSTNKVGWYAFGTVPGQTGSAILDAHVFAAFSKLRYVKVGSDIEIETVAGKTLRFTVTDSRVYNLSEVPLDYIFNRHDTQRLNLITCAGKPTSDGSTYDHRLVVYAERAR
jgi:LPXTG-site transpeptidase (sortase) family protein